MTWACYIARHEEHATGWSMAGQEAQDEAECAGNQMSLSAEKGKSGVDTAYTDGYAETWNAIAHRWRKLAMQVLRRNARCARKRSGNTSVLGVKPKPAAFPAPKSTKAQLVCYQASQLSSSDC